MVSLYSCHCHDNDIMLRKTSVIEKNQIKFFRSIPALLAPRTSALTSVLTLRHWRMAPRSPVGRARRTTGSTRSSARTSSTAQSSTSGGEMGGETAAVMSDFCVVMSDFCVVIFV